MDTRKVRNKGVAFQRFTARPLRTDLMNKEQTYFITWRYLHLLVMLFFCSTGMLLREVYFFATLSFLSHHYVPKDFLFLIKVTLGSLFSSVRSITINDYLTFICHLYIENIWHPLLPYSKLGFFWCQWGHLYLI